MKDDDLIVDRIVCGVKDSRVRIRLLREKDLNLQRTIDICKAAEEADQLVRNLKTANLNVDRIRQKNEKAGNQTQSKRKQGSRMDSTKTQCQHRADSSSEELGAVLLQDKAPVAYASKTLTDTQRNYAQIEKELLAIVFGCKRFRQYIYGKRVIVEIDHKLLESIFKKNIEKCPLRLQRLLINLQNYDIDVKYVPGAKLYLADTLSRASYNDKNFEILENNTEADVDLIHYFSISSKQFRKPQVETQNDDELQLLRGVIKIRWPNNKNKIDCVK